MSGSSDDHGGGKAAGVGHEAKLARSSVTRRWWWLRADAARRL